MINYAALTESWRRRLSDELRTFTRDAVDTLVGVVLTAGKGPIYDERLERGDGQKAAGCCTACAAERDSADQETDALDEVAEPADRAAHGRRGRRGGRRHRRRQDGAADAAPGAE